VQAPLLGKEDKGEAGLSIPTNRRPTQKSLARTGGTDHWLKAPSLTWLAYLISNP
jgi:hypothetical protein